MEMFAGCSDVLKMKGPRHTHRAERRFALSVEMFEEPYPTRPKVFLSLFLGWKLTIDLSLFQII